MAGIARASVAIFILRCNSRHTMNHFASAQAHTQHVHRAVQTPSPARSTVFASPQGDPRPIRHAKLFAHPVLTQGGRQGGPIRLVLVSLGGQQPDTWRQADQVDGGARLQPLPALSASPPATWGAAFSGRFVCGSGGQTPLPSGRCWPDSPPSPVPPDIGAKMQMCYSCLARAPLKYRLASPAPPPVPPGPSLFSQSNLLP